MPENIRYGVTITPPSGSPVTGTARPEWNSANNYAIVGQYGVAGNIMSVSNNPNNYTTRSGANGFNVTLPNGYYYFKIIFGKLDPSTTALNISGGGISKTFDVSSLSSNYNRQNSMGIPSQFSEFEFGSTANGQISFSVTSGANTYWSIAVFIVGPSNSGLLAENIAEGTTINGIVGTMKVEDATDFIAFVQNGENSADAKCLATQNKLSWGYAGLPSAISLSQSSTDVFSYIKGSLVGPSNVSGSFNYTGGNWNGNGGQININGIAGYNISAFNITQYTQWGSAIFLKIGSAIALDL